MIKTKLLLALAVVTGISCSPVKQTREDATNDPTVQAQAGITTHSTQHSINSSWSSSDTSFLQMQSVWLFAGDTEPMTQKVLDALAQQLNTTSKIPDVTVIPFGDAPPLGSRLPDILLTVDLQSMTEEKQLLKAKHTTELHLSGGSRLMSSNYSSSDSLTPPRLDWSIDGTVSNELNHEGIQIGVDLEDISANKLAESLQQAIQTKLTEFAEKIPKIGPLPSYLYPTYEPQALPEALVTLQPRQMLSGNRAFTPYDSYWLLSTSASETIPLTSIKKQLEAEGWSIKRFETNPNSLPGLRAMRQEAAEVISIWPKSETEAASEYVIHHQLRLSRTKLQALIDQAFDAQASLKLLAHFYQNWSPENQQRFVERAQQTPLHTALSTWVLVNAYEELGQTENALRLLNLSYLLGRINGKHTDNRLTKKGQELSGDSNWKPSFPPQATLDALGIPIIESGAKIAPITLESGQPALFSTNDRNENKILAFFQIQPNGDQHYTVRTGHVMLDQSESITSEITSECSLLNPIQTNQHIGSNQLRFNCYRTPEAPNTFTLECKIK